MLPGRNKHTQNGSRGRDAYKARRKTYVQSVLVPTERLARRGVVRNAWFFVTSFLAWRATKILFGLCEWHKRTTKGSTRVLFLHSGCRMVVVTVVALFGRCSFVLLLGLWLCATCIVRSSLMTIHFWYDTYVDFYRETRSSFVGGTNSLLSVFTLSFGS